MVTLGQLKAATGHDAVTNFLEESILPGSEWSLVKVRRKSVRLEPPLAYWATYRVVLGRGELVYPEPAAVAADMAADQATPVGGTAPLEVSPAPEPGEADALPEPRWSEERELRLVARGVFDGDYWPGYRDKLSGLFGGKRCDPLDGLGYPVLHEPTQHAFWFYPVDPNLPNLHRAADRQAMKRLFRANKRSVLDYPARVTDVKLELARYLPEISAIIRYDIETNPGAASKTIYGKVQHSGRGAESNRVMTEIWKEFKRSKLALRVPRPLGYYPELGLYLQDSVPGKALANDRTAPEYLPAVMQAAEALAAIHESGIPTVNELPLEAEVARLDRTLDQFALVHPNAYFLLREYLTHMRETLKKLPEEEWLPTHGDFKYDQLLVDPETGNYSLIDFDFFGRAETSYDVARFCAYVMPSMPKDWEQSYAGEQARQAFLRRYRELRPDATLHRFPIYESVNLAGRAMTLMWSQMRNWESAAESMLVLAMERLKSKAP